MPKPKTVCGSGQVSINDQCINLPSNCADINIYYQCTKCNKNYNL